MRLVVEYRSDYASLFKVILDQKNCLSRVFSHRLHLGTSNLAITCLRFMSCAEPFQTKLIEESQSLAQQYCSLLLTSG